MRMDQISWPPLSEPMVKTEKEAGCDVWYSASAAAIFIGC